MWKLELTPELLAVFLGIAEHALHFKWNLVLVLLVVTILYELLKRIRVLSEISATFLNIVSTSLTNET